MTASDPKVACAKIITRAHHLREQHAGKLFEGIGVTVPGRVDPATQRLILAPNLKWQGFDIKAALEKGTGLQVEIDNDANACLLSEIWYGRLEGVKNAVLIAVSEGIGAAILAGGHIQSGFNGLAGEFGHIPIDPAGPLCGCGQKGCWEVLASSRAALQYHQKLAPQSSVRDIRALLHLAEEKDHAAVQAICKQAKHLGSGLRLITAALAPELILITGDITSCWDTVGPILQKELASTMLAGAPPRLAPVGDGYLARLSGGAAVLLQRHSRYYHSTHASRGRKPAAARRTPQQEA
jgi:predicted NBD/HSP70 family sugar kinase